MGWFLQPRHTFRSGLLQIIEGLENGSIVLTPRDETFSSSPEAGKGDLIQELTAVLNRLEGSLQRARRLVFKQYLIILGIMGCGVSMVVLGTVGVFLGNVVWPYWMTIVLGILPCVATIGVVRQLLKHRDRIVREELFIAVLRATPSEERPWQFLRLYPEFEQDLEKGETGAKPVFQHAKQVFDGWRINPPAKTFSN